MMTPATTRQRWTTVGIAFFGCFLLTLAARSAFHGWHDRRPTPKAGPRPVAEIVGASGTRPSEGDLPAHLDRPDVLVAARMEWGHLQDALARESDDEVRFGLKKFSRFGLDAVPLLVPLLKRGGSASDQVLALAALAHARPIASGAADGAPSDLGHMLLRQSLEQALEDPGHSLACNTLFDTRDRQLKKAVLLGLAAPNLPWGVELLRRYLIEAYAGEETQLLVLAVDCASDAGGSDARALLLELLGRPVSQEVKDEVAARLGKFQPEGLADDIERLLRSSQSTEDKVRLAALLTSQAPKSVTDGTREELRPLLVEALKARESNDGLKQQALRALGGLGDEKSLEALADALKQLVTPELVRVAAEELSRHPDGEIGARLLAVPPEQVKVNEIERISVGLDIAEGLRRDDLRQRAVEIGKPYLQHILLDTQWASIQQEAMLTLAKMGPNDANPVLWDVAANEKENDVIRKRALVILQDTGGQGQVQPLTELEQREKKQEIRDRIHQTILAIQARGR